MAVTDNTKNNTMLVAVLVFLLVSGWYGSSVLSDLGSWNDWDKPAEVAKMWKAGLFGLAAMLLAMGVDLKKLLGPFGAFLPGGAVPTQASNASASNPPSPPPADPKP